MRLCLVYPSWTQSYGITGYFARRNSTWTPHNLCLLAACVWPDHQCDIIDGEAEGLTNKQVVDRINKNNYDVVGFTATSPFYHTVKDCATKLRQSGYPGTVIIGGPHATIMEEKIADYPWHYVFSGDAEWSLPKFMDDIEKYGSSKAGHQIITQKEVIGRDYQFDDLPMQAVWKLKLGNYKLGTLGGRKRFITIQGMRGCPWKCIFCASDKLNTTRVVQRSPQSIFDEMKHIADIEGTTHFMFADDVLTLYPERMLKLANMIIENDLRVTFEGNTRANLLDENMMDILSAAGLTRLSFGFESSNDEIRTLMKKKVPVRHYEQANEWCEQYGVEALNSVMIGLPGETRETAMSTINYIAEARPVKQANLSIAVPYPGTEFHDIAAAGIHGVMITDDDVDFTNYRRYGSAVTNVNDLKEEDLIALQNIGFLKIYSKWWRWKSMYGKHGFFGFILMMFRLLKHIKYWGK
jgi:radical SAM superfamily enzyme YgiQ (UPF0313 family)